jgi:tetratricopeptide (TPR) repeat protein
VKLNIQKRLLALAVLPFVVMGPVLAATRVSDSWPKFITGAAKATTEENFESAEKLLKAALAEAEQQKNGYRNAETLYRLGRLYQRYAFYDQAQTAYTQALAAMSASGASQFPKLRTAEIWRDLGFISRARGDSAESAIRFQKALQIATSVLSPGHPDIDTFREPPPPVDPTGATFPTLATAFNSLGDLQRARGKPAEAEAAYKRALSEAEKTDDLPESSHLLILNNLGDLYVDEGRIKEAEELYSKAVAIARNLSSNKQLPEGDSRDANLALTLDSLGDFYRAHGNLDRAETLYRNAIQLGESQSNTVLTDLAVVYNDLGDLLASQKRQTEADQFYNRSRELAQQTAAAARRDINTYKAALEIDQDVLGEWHADIAQDLNNLADATRAQGNFETAEYLYRRALAVAEYNFGPDNPLAARTLNDLGDLYRTTGRIDKADAAYERSLMLSKRAAKASDMVASEIPHSELKHHEGMAAELNRLADMLRAKGRYNQAESLYLKAVSAAEEDASANKPQLLMALNNLADLYIAQGKQELAKKMKARASSLK